MHMQYLKPSGARCLVWAQTRQDDFFLEGFGVPPSKNFPLLFSLLSPHPDSFSPPGFLWSLRGEQEAGHRPSPSSRPQLKEEEACPPGTTSYSLGISTDTQWAYQLLN